MKQSFRFYVKLINVIMFITLTNICFAQDTTVTGLKTASAMEIKKDKIDSSKLWNTGGLFTLHFGQGSQSNWAAGGDDFSLSLNSGLDLYAFYKKDRWSWDNTLSLDYGFVKTTSLGVRKNDDRIDLLSKAGYALKPKLSLSTLVNFHSQFTKGYDYTSAGTFTLLSDFLSPGYLLWSLGLDYKPVDGLSVFISPIASRWTFVINNTLSAKGSYGLDPGEKVRNEIGAFASITYIKNISKQISYNGRLDLFSNYEHNPQNVDLNWTNSFDAKISKLLTASFKFDMIYDDDVKLFGPNNDSPGLQVKSLLGVGLTVKL